MFALSPSGLEGKDGKKCLISGSKFNSSRSCACGGCRRVKNHMTAYCQHSVPLSSIHGACGNNVSEAAQTVTVNASM